MKQITNIVLMVALTASAASYALGQKALARNGGSNTGGSNNSAGVVEEIQQLERDYNQAFIKPTAELMDRFHTGDFRMTARGKITTKADLLARLNDPNHPPYVIESLTSDDVTVRIYGDTAVTTGHWARVSKDVSGNDTSATGYFTHVWVKTNKSWQLAVAHYSPISGAAKPQ